MNQLLLWVVMRFSGAWEGLGADVTQLHAMLKTRLMVDDRKPMTMGRQQKQRRVKYGSIISSLAFLLMGLAYIMPLFTVTDRIYAMALYFSFVLGILTFMLLTDFSNVLFDPRDKYILFPRPIDDRTLVMSRVLYIVIYVTRISAPLTLAGWVIISVKDGWKGAVLFPFAVLLVVLTAIFLVNSMYLLVLRVVRPERFKDVINYFQIFATIFFVGSFYMMPRMFDNENPLVHNIVNNPWIRFVPSYWIACCWSWLGYTSAYPGALWYSDLGVFVPIFCIILIVKVLAPQFVRRMAGIDAVEVAPVPLAEKGGTQRRGAFYKLVAGLFCRNSDERAGFTIAWLMSARSRSFRMRVYPSFAMVLMYFAYLFSVSNHSFSETMARMSHRPFHLFMLYYASFVMVNAMNYMVMSDQYKAAWVYYAAPVELPGRIMVGALKAMWVKFVLPFYIILSVFILYVWGATAIWDIILALINVTLFVAALARTGLRHLPFSIMEINKQKGSRVVKSLIAMIIPMALGGGHFLCVLANILWLKFLFMALSGAFLWLVWTSYAATSWSSMIKGEMEG